MIEAKISLRKQILFWLIACIIFLLIIATLREILLPFIVGLAIAYFLDPVADFLEDIGFSRLWATILIVTVFGIFVTITLILIIPFLINELTNLASNIPGYLITLKEFFFNAHQEWFGKYLPIDKNELETVSQNLTKQVPEWIGKNITSLLSGGLAVFNFLSLILITPVVTFYLLKDWDKIVGIVDRSLPRDHADTIRSLAKEIDSVMAGFVRGQVTVLILLGLFYVIGLKLAGLNYGILIGTIAGLISFIPFVGSAVGFILAGSVALVQFWPEWIPIVSVLGIFLIGQAIEGNLLSPKIVGDSVQLHPVWLIFSLFVFGYLFGFVGLLIAVPVAAAIGVLVRFAFDQYCKSEVYLGQDYNKNKSEAD